MDEATAKTHMMEERTNLLQVVLRPLHTVAYIHTQNKLLGFFLYFKKKIHKSTYTTGLILIHF